LVSLTELLCAVRAENVHGSRLELTRTGGALLIRRRIALHAILDGEGVLDVPATGERQAFRPGSVLLVSHGVVHRLRPDGRGLADSARRARRLPGPSHPDALPILRFGSGDPVVQTISMVFDLGPARANPLVRMLPTICAARERDRLGLELRDTLDRAAGLPGAALFADRFANLAFVEIIRRHVAETGVLSRLGAYLTNAAPIERVIAAVNARPGEDWSLVSLAVQAGMSRSAFASAFTRHVGQPAMSYVFQTRMLRAAELLRSTDLGTAAVAAHVGYQSGSALARSFRRYFGVGPGDYRRAPAIEPLEPPVLDCVPSVQGCPPAPSRRVTGAFD
jgi:AraC family transcriptional regulator, activator of mtrCDE